MQRCSNRRSLAAKPQWQSQRCNTRKSAERARTERPNRVRARAAGRPSHGAHGRGDPQRAGAHAQQARSHCFRSSCCSPTPGAAAAGRAACTPVRGPCPRDGCCGGRGGWSPRACSARGWLLRGRAPRSVATARRRAAPHAPPSSRLWRHGSGGPCARARRQPACAARHVRSWGRRACSRCARAHGREGRGGRGRAGPVSRRACGRCCQPCLRACA